MTNFDFIYRWCIKTFAPTAIVPTVYTGLIAGSIYVTPALATRLFVARKLTLIGEPANILGNEDAIYLNTNAAESEYYRVQNRTMMFDVTGSNVWTASNHIVLKDLHFFSLDLSEAINAASASMHFQGYVLTLP
jgi:hypothetical protein